MILSDYNRGSGYGSVSRTVEEIILAFDSIYRTLTTFKQQLPFMISPQLTNDQKLQIFLSLTTTLMSIDNALSRLTLATLQDTDAHQEGKKP